MHIPVAKVLAAAVAIGIEVTVKEINQGISAGMKDYLRRTVRHMGTGAGEIME